MKVIHINESKFNRILEEKDYLPFKTFYDETIKFLNSLLKDPIGARPSDKLQSYGIENGPFRNKLYDKNIISKKERIDEPYDEESGKMTSRYYVSYKVIDTETTKKKLRELHKEMFDND